MARYVFTSKREFHMASIKNRQEATFWQKKYDLQAPKIVTDELSGALPSVRCGGG
jgi:hypothetical protein